MQNNKVEHLYIHIPFCEEICTYCDFYRTKTKDQNVVESYVKKIIHEINQDNNLYKTIYIGGGTPNFLNDYLLNLLLSSLKNKLQNDYEFTIEANPEFISKTQIEILMKNNVNRISIGVQTTNNNILKLLKRTHNIESVVNTIELLHKYQFKNISCDFIYNLPLLKNSDFNETFSFIDKYKINHISFYSLEIKEGSILNKTKYKLDTNIEESHLELVKKHFKALGYQRYEISNWALNANSYSKHNIAYWDLKYWKAIGISGFGFENNIYYKNSGTILDWSKQKEYWDKKEIYENIFIMGLRKIEGIDLSINRNKEAYLYLKDKINHELVIIENNFIKAKNIDLLNDILIDII